MTKSMKVLTGTRAFLEQEAASIIKQVAQGKSCFVLGICGGTSVAGIFHKLLEARLAWKHVQIFFVDERWVELTSSDSNYRLAKQAFLDELFKRKMLPESNVHAFSSSSTTTEYTKEFQQYERFDLVLLSAGQDGHVASLFPNHASVQDSSVGFIEVQQTPKPPPHRMSASRALLENSTAAILVFFGKEKKIALEKFQITDSVADCPACLVKRIEKVHVLDGTKE